MAKTPIDAKGAQNALTGAKLYSGKIDGLFGPKSWIALVGYAAPTAKPGSDAVTLRGRKLAEVAQDFGITTAEQIAGFLSNTTHETGDYSKLAENLYYTSASRIRATWPNRFKTDADALPFVRNPIDLANKVYARPKEGNVNPGDGWKYRGRGDYQTTFANGYRATGADLGLPLLDHPEMLEAPPFALLAGLSYWRQHDLGRFFDAGTPKRARALANAGDPDFPNPIGWDDVLARHNRLMGILA